MKETLLSLVKVLQTQRPQSGCRGLKFHQDNTRPHVDKSVINFLKDREMIIMNHPPYPPNLAPYNFWLFDYIKQCLGDHTSFDSMRNGISKIINDIPRNKWEYMFDKWFKRMRLA